MSAWPAASLHLDAGRDFRGGQRQVLYLLQGLQERGQRVLLCSPQHAPLYERATSAGIPCRPFTLRSGFDFPSAVRLARLVRDGGFDLVHVHDARSHGIARVAQGIAHHPALVQNLFVTRRSIGSSSGALDRLKYASAGTRYIAISSAVRESLLRLGVTAAQVLVVPSGIEVGRLAAARAAGIDLWELRSRDRWTVGSVGALSRDKNPLLLLEAFARARAEIPNAHLLYAGEGPLRPALEQRARELEIAACVTLAGRLEDVAPAYAAMSVFALASDHEGLCTALLDAMGAGVPVATTAAGGVLDIARHGDSALVVPPRDVEALASALVRLHAQPDLAARLVDGGRRVAEQHGVARMVEGTLAAYARLGQASPAPATSGAARPGLRTGGRSA